MIASQRLSFSEIGLARRSVRISKLKECSNGFSGGGKTDVYGPEISRFLSGLIRDRSSRQCEETGRAYAKVVPGLWIARPSMRPVPESQYDLRLPRKK
jgi:hypothetical protein